MDGNEALIYLVVGLVVFFIGKIIATWYFDINDIIKNQKEQIELLKKLLDKDK